MQQPAAAKNVVLVEDNPDLVESMRVLLELNGCTVRTFFRARDLLDWAALGPDHIVVTDYYLPDMNGVELIRQLRRRHPRLRVMLVTGSREELILKSARSIANCELLFKPVDCEDLCRRFIDRLEAA
jgi:DNA-binding NtrC family response regulator